MNLQLLLGTLALVFLTSFSASSQSTVYAVAPSSGNFDIIDTTTMTVSSSIAMTSTTGTVNGANGLTSDECGILYIVYQVSGTRYLGIIDPTTAVITEIGALADNVSNIAYVNGLLLGVTGDGASTPETLYEINIATAAMTLIIPLGNGDDGESIAFNPDDGLLYHWSGWGTASVIMETINPTTFTISSVTLSGDPLANVGASTYAGNGQFLISDVNSNGLKYISTSGVVSATSNTTGVYKGLAFPGGNASVTNTTAANDSICMGDTAVLVCNTLGTYNWTLNGTATGNTTNTFNATTQGAYVCEVNTGACTVLSDTVFLTVSNVPTTVLTPSPNASICDGDSVELSLNTGGGFGQFQWYLNGSMISGATGSSYFATAGGSYNATKTNQNGCSDSSTVATVVTVNPIPTANITPSPTADICEGDSVELTVNVGGGAGTVQWYMNGTVIPGATNASYFASTTGSYNVLKTNQNGCSDSSAIATVVNVAAYPIVSITPSPTVNFCAGDSVELVINTFAVGSYQWYVNGTVISGATSTSYFAYNEGAYNAIVTNAEGCSDSSVVATTLIDTCENNLYELSNLSFDLYPNPTSNVIHIDFNSLTHADIVQLDLIGIEGKVIRVFTVEDANGNGLTLDVSDVNNGVYFVRLSTNYGTITKEIVIE